MRKFVMAVILGLTPVAGQACTYLEPFDMTRIDGADLVVVGKVTSYDPIRDNWNAALVTIEVEKTLKGKATGTMTFIWNGGLAAGPREDLATGRVLLGAMRGDRIAVSDMTPDARPDLPSVVQPYCGEAWIVPATRASIANARKVLE